MITIIIVSITNFSIVIGPPSAYLSRNRCVIMRCPITGIRFELFAIGDPHFNGFLHNVFYSFQNLQKALQTFSLKRNSQKTFLIPKFVIDTIN